MCPALEELCIAALAWLPSRPGLAMRLLAWRPLFEACGKVRFGPSLVLQGCANMRLADGVRLGHGCRLHAVDNGRLEIGPDTALSPGVTVDASSGLIRLGRQVAIGPGTVIRAANHRFDRTDVPIMLQGHDYGEVLVEDDVWIAANCTITPGVRIGRGAVIGAGAVVTRDVPPMTVAAGVPARPLRQRGNREDHPLQASSERRF